MDEKDTTPQENQENQVNQVNQENQENQENQQRKNCSSKRATDHKRVMTPAIDGMTVRKERACLSEIRALSPDITYLHVLSNGWTAGEFALRYVTGHHRKRKSKTQNNST